MEKIKPYLVLHTGFLIFSLGAVFSKFAGQHPVLSCYFLLNYGLMLGTVGTYALVWQQVLTQLPLMTAFSNKAVVVIWGLLWGVILFDESLSTSKVLGAILVIAGVVIMVNSDE